MNDPIAMALVGGVLVAIIFLVAYIFVTSFIRSLRPQRDPSRHLNTDYTNMMILFQTMRDLLAQQKDLARQFNASVDKKVKTVRELVDHAKEEREQLRKAQHDIGVLLQEAKDDLASLQRQVAYLTDHVDAPSQSEPPHPPRTSKPPEAATEAPGASASPSSAAPAAEHLEVPTVIPSAGDDQERDTQLPADAPDDDDLIDSWTGFDFGAGNEPQPAGEPQPESGSQPEPAPQPGAAPQSEDRTPSAAAEELKASRDAMRSLLDFDTAPAAPANANANAHGNASSNGNDKVTPLQRRVYEYNDAGMSVHEIARELGVGKGEIRLMLSLREQKQ